MSVKKNEIQKYNLFRYRSGTILLAHLYENCVFLQLYSIALKWLKWKVVRHLLGNRTGRHCSQQNRNEKRLFPMSVGCPRSGQVDDADACGTLRSLMGIEEITSPAEIYLQTLSTLVD